MAEILGASMVKLEMTAVDCLFTWLTRYATFQKSLSVKRLLVFTHILWSSKFFSCNFKYLFNNAVFLSKNSE